MPGSSVFNFSRALEYMKQCDVDVLIATSAYNVRYFTGYSCWLDSLFKTHMMRPEDSSRLLSPTYAFVCATGERALVVSASTAVIQSWSRPPGCPSATIASRWIPISPWNREWWSIWRLPFSSPLPERFRLKKDLSLRKMAIGITASRTGRGLM